MLERIALIVLVACWPLSALGAAAGGEAAYWEQPDVSIDNRASLQRGASLFTNYCMGCHSARHHRWMHVAEDLGIPERVVEDNLIWTTDAQGKKDRIGARMRVAMDDSYGERVFGNPPPDLTLTARSRGPAWVYNYLRAFYIDESSPTGVDNAVLPGAAMPHVLWPLQGWQRPVYAEDGGHGPIVDFEQVQEGSMTPAEYDRAINDIVNYMVYLAEPARMDRTAIGGWVLLFLLVLLLFAYLLKKEYWKDVH